jgi:cell division protein FtsI (penicillin-binding protein 3)
MAQIALDTTSFGQGMSATGLQTVVAMAAIANGGAVLRPYVVQKVVAPDGTVLLSQKREVVRRAIRGDTSRAVTAMLEEVVQKGTGTRAALAEYRAAGKTGTAQKVDPIHGGYSEKRLSSFLGFAPADAPQVAILVVIDEPEGKGGEVTGAVVAAPAWGAIAREALRQLDVLPDSAREVAPVEVAKAPAPDPVPAGEAEVSAAEAGSDKSVVPDVAGLGARTAIRRLAAASLEPDLRGSGRAVAQSPRPGAIVKRGARVRVTLAPPG